MEKETQKKKLLNLFSEDINLINIIKFTPLVIIVIITIIAAIHISDDYSENLEKDKYKIKNEYINSNKERVRANIETAYQYINEEFATSNTQLKEKIKDELYNAHSIMTSIYNKYKDKKNKEEIIEIIKSALQDMRFNDGRGYFFILDLKGMTILHPIKPDYEGKNLYNVPDARGVYRTQDSIKIAKSKQGEGYQSWHFYRPDSMEKEHEKIGYIKKFTPYDWFIGTGEYVEDFQKQVKKNILKYLSMLKYQDNGYIFVLEQTGNILVNKNKELEGINIHHTRNFETLSRKFTKFIDSNESSRFIEYQFSTLKEKEIQKVSIVKKIEETNWVIGLGFNLNKLNAEIEKTIVKLETEQAQKLQELYIASFIVALVLLTLSLYIAQIIEKKFNKLKLKLVEKEQEKLNELRKILDNLPVMIMYKDTKNNIIRANQAVADSFDLTVHDLKNIHYKEIYPNDYDRYYNDDLEIIKTKKSKIGHREEYVAKDGLRTIETSKIPILNEDGEVENIIVFIIDITEKLHLFALLENSQSIAKMGSWEQVLDETLIWSKETYKIFEFDIDSQVTLKKFLERVHPDDREDVSLTFKTSIQEQEPYYIEHRLLFPDGRIKYVIERAEHYYDSAKTHLRTTGTVQDVTYNKEVEIAFEESQNNYKLLADNVIDVIWKMDINLKFIYVNPSISKLLGYTEDEWLGTKLGEHCSEEEFVKINQLIVETIENKIVDGVKFESFLFDKNGKEVAVEINGKIIYNQDGKPIEIQGSTREFTKQLNARNKIKYALYELENKKKELETIIQEAPSPMILHNDDGKILMLNQAWTDSSGYTIEDIPTIDDWINCAYEEEKRGTVKTYIDSLYKITKKVDEYEFRFKHKNKKDLIWQFSSAPLSVVDGKRMIISSAMDITELKQKDEILIKQSRLAAMGEMIGMIAHQWRQPLSTISMAVNNIFADVALEAFEQEKGLSELESIAYQVQELSKIIDDFRNFFKPDKEASIIKIETIIEETLFIVKDSLINNAIELKILNNSQTPIEVYSRELMQVFVNVINNSKDALKEVIEKEKIIEINIYEDEEYIITEICDNGTGIDEKILPNIFNPYFSTKDAKTGTGLGLYMSKMIIEDHMHGNIDVKNRDIGVCFIIKLLKER